MSTTVVSRRPNRCSTIWSSRANASSLAARSSSPSPTTARNRSLDTTWSGAKCSAAHDDLPDPDAPTSTTRHGEGSRVAITRTMANGNGGRMWRRLHLEDTALVLRAVMRCPPLRNAEIAFALAVTSEAAFTVTLGVVSFRSGGAAGVGLVALLRMLPSAVGTALITPYADRTNRVRVLAVVVVVRAAAIGACGLLLASDAPLATVYGLAVVATIAMAAFRPVHSALLPPCAWTPTS